MMFYRDFIWRGAVFVFQDLAYFKGVFSVVIQVLVAPGSSKLYYNGL